VNTYWVKATTDGNSDAVATVQITVQAQPPPPSPPAYNPVTCAHMLMCALVDVSGDKVMDAVGFADSADLGSGFRGRALVSTGVRTTGADGTVTVTYGPWASWGMTGCDTPGEDCQFEDMNYDGYGDVVEFVKSSVTGTTPNPRTGAHQGNVLVYWSQGTGFGPARPVTVAGGDGSAVSFCTGSQTCQLGDVNGDQFPDAVAFTKSTITGTPEGDVWVGLGFPGASFPDGPFDGFLVQQWSGSMCVQAETCALGDVNGDGRDDAVAFVKSTRGGAEEGDVWVALSDPAGTRITGSFLPATRWSDNICVHEEVCGVFDVNGDHNADAVAKDPRDISLAPNQVYAGLSAPTGGGGTFGARQVVIPPTGAMSAAAPNRKKTPAECAVALAEYRRLLHLMRYYRDMFLDTADIHYYELYVQTQDDVYVAAKELCFAVTTA
jgi:hypothetical protein